MLVKIDNYRVERIGRDFQPEPLGDSLPVIVDLCEFAVLEIFFQLPFAELVLAARLGHERNVGVLRQFVTETLGDEHLPRRVREMFFGPNDVADLHVVIVDDAGQMIQAGSVGPLDDVILLAGPLDFDPAADQIVDHHAALARHLQSHDRLPILGLEGSLLPVRFGHPAAAVDEVALRALGRLALGLNLLGPRIIAIGQAGVEQFVGGLLIAIELLRLKIRPMRPLFVRPFVPVDSQPAKACEDRFQRLGHVTLLIRVVDPQNELPAVPPGE